jgi:hypothetical protein
MKINKEKMEMEIFLVPSHNDYLGIISGLTMIPGLKNMYR